jgi:hypothetical protein
MRRVEGFSARERDAYWGGLRAQGEPMVPVGWATEVVLLVLDAAVQAIVEENMAAVVCAIPVGLSLGKLRTELGKRRARALGLTSEIAPQLRFSWETLGLALGWRAYLRVRGLKPRKPDVAWTFTQSLIREIERRRAWRRALMSETLGRRP